MGNWKKCIIITKLWAQYHVSVKNFHAVIGWRKKFSKLRLQLKRKGKRVQKIFYLNQRQVFHGPLLQRLPYPPTPSTVALSVLTHPEPMYPECIQSKKHK